MKEQPQRSLRRIIERPRLINQLEESDARTILLIAPAGYGKTTLLEQWARLHPPSWSYTAGPGSADLAHLATGLAAALETGSPGLKQEVSQIVRTLSNPARQSRELLDAFASRLATNPAGTAIVDDYHLLADGSTAEMFVYDLCDRLEARLVVASRVRPIWATARRELYGDRLELGSAELALSADESAELLSSATPALRETLLIRARGWPAVIGIASVRNSTRRAPGEAVTTTLFRFFAEELFSTTREEFQDELLSMALLPSLSSELMEAHFGDRATSLLTEAIREGFVTMSDRQHDLHPLIREFLFSKITEQRNVEERVRQAVSVSLDLEEWDNAFVLITRFDRVDLIEAFLTAAFMPLTRVGRVSTLEQVAAWTRPYAKGFSPAVGLIEAELALRDGRFELAQELAVHSAERLQCTHALTPHAHWIAGQAAHLSGNFEIASRHFQRARSTATEESDVRDALWGLVGVLIFSEVSAAHEVVVELSRRQSHSPTDLVLATNAALLLRRYSPNAGPFATETALHCLDLVPDPRVRSSFTYLLSYDALLRSDYERAQRISKATLEQSNQYQLTWAVPHAEWVLAAASLGLRKFPQVDRWLARVERAADAHDDPHLRLNAAALRARFLLALQEPARAYEILAFDDSGTVNPAMRAELIAMRALALALLGDTGRAETSAKEASSMTTSVEVAAYVACVRAICRLDSNAVREALAIAERLDIWDPMICAVRAHPPLLQLVKEAGTSLAQLGTLLRRSNDFDLARRASIPIGKRPKTERTPLSPREHEVLELISQGLTDRQIGEVLFISPGTAKVHGRHVLEKLGARTRAEAVARYKLERD